MSGVVSRAVRRGTVAVNAYGNLPGQGSSSSEELLTDLIADLLHWADEEEIDADEVLRSARMHYDNEINEEEL